MDKKHIFIYETLIDPVRYDFVGLCVNFLQSEKTFTYEHTL